jgi:predicted Zn-dependent peptidase
MLFKGTTRRPSAEIISETIERVGGSLNASTDKELTVYWAKVSKDRAGLALDVLSDMLRESLFDPSEFEKEQRVVIEELGMSLDAPQEWVHTLADERCWPGTPIGRDVAGTRESVVALSCAQVLSFARSHYLPSAIVVAVAGGIGHKEALSLAEENFGGWTPKSDASRATLDDITFPEETPSVYFEARATEQSNLCLATRGIPRMSPDRFGFELLVAILGGSMSSRLFLEIRERRGLAYDIHSYGNTLSETASLVTYAAVEPNRVLDVMTEVLRQMHLLRSELVSVSELDKVKDYYKGRLLLGLEDTQSVAGWCGVQQALQGEIRQPEDVCGDVDLVTRDDIKRIASECFKTEYLRLVVLGPQKGTKGLQEALTL